MASNRIGRINEAIREALAGLLRTVKDPRVTESMLTITHVDTTSDLRYTPELQFIMDDSIAHGAHILDLLSHEKPANPANADIVLPEDRE